MSIAIVVWIEVFIALALRWMLLNERLERTIRARHPDQYLSRNERTALLIRDPKAFARTAPREWLKGLAARTDASTDPLVERDRSRGNVGYVAIVAYLFLGTPLVLAAVGIIGRASSVFLAASLLVLQVVLLAYWLRRLLVARRLPEPDTLAGAIAVAGLCDVLICAAAVTVLLVPTF